MLLNSENFNLRYQWCKFIKVQHYSVSFLLQEAITAGACGSRGPVSASDREKYHMELMVERSRIEK